MSKQKHTLESIAMTTLKEGKWFYSNKEDKHLTAISSHLGVRIKTERVLIVNPQTAETVKATKVTLLKESACKSKNPNDMCDNCDCWKHTRLNCS